MHTTASNPVARLLAPVGKLTLALFGAAAIGTAFAGEETVRALWPYGCAKLRMTELPPAQKT